MPSQIKTIVPQTISRGPNQLPTNQPRQNLEDYTARLPGPTSDPINDSVFTDEQFAISIKDAVDFKIRDVVNKKTLQFRCTVSNITESSQPVWNQVDYVGRPYPVWFYKGVTRTVTFDFRVYPNNRNELPIVWNKINYLSGLTHPAAYTSGGYMVPPYIEFTIGNLFKNQFGFIASYSNTIAPESSWETRGDMRVPHIADINLTINVIENELKTPFKELYGFDLVYALDTDPRRVRPQGPDLLPSNPPNLPNRL